MKDGSSKTLSDGNKPETELVDDTKERMSDFIERHAAAEANGDKWVETTPEIIKLLQPRGLAGKKYFSWKNVLVCENGMSKQIEHEESKTMHDRMHPESKTTVISGAI